MRYNKSIVRLVLICLIACGLLYFYYQHIKHEMNKEYSKPDNEYTLKYAEYAETLENIYETYDYDRDKLLKNDIRGRITQALDKTSIDENLKLFISLPQEGYDGMAHFQIIDSDENIEEEKLYWIEDYHWDNIKVEPSAMGAWQMYLLMNSCNMGPLYGHSCYSDITFYHADRKNFEKNVYQFGYGNEKPKSLKKALDNVEYHQPIVIYDDSLKVADVFVMFWSDWGGLIDDSVRVEFLHDGTATCKRGKPKILIEYDCGVEF